VNGEAPQTGDVFWCEDFPGLHGHEPKSRWAVVVSPPDQLPDKDGNYLVVPTSESTLSKYIIKLPNEADTPQCTSGLPKPCSAVCDDFKLVKVGALTKRVGDLRTPTVARIQQLVLLVVKERTAQREIEAKRSAPAPASPRAASLPDSAG